MKKQNISKQKGFTLVQVLIGIAVLGTAFVGSISSNQDNAKVINVNTFFSGGMNSAISFCYDGSSLTSCTKNKLIRLGGISSKNQNTEWGDIWTVTPASSTVTITYPLDSSSSADEIGADITDKLANSSAPISASYDSATSDLTIVYQY